MTLSSGVIHFQWQTASTPPVSAGRHQERAAEDEDWERADACHIRIRNALALTLPDGDPVAEFMLRIHNNGTADWRWHDEPFDAVNP